MRGAKLDPKTRNTGVSPACPPPAPACCRPSTRFLSVCSPSSAPFARPAFFIDFRCPHPSRRHAQRTSGSNLPPPPPLTLLTLSTIASSRPEILLASRLALRYSVSDHPPAHSTLDDQERAPVHLTMSVHAGPHPLLSPTTTDPHAPATFSLPIAIRPADDKDIVTMDSLNKDATVQEKG